jgi:hypothetical protein
MKLFIVALEGLEHQFMPQCARDAKACAELFSGAEVVAISEFPEPGWLDAAQFGERAFAFRKKFAEAWGSETSRLPNLMRCFIMDEYIKANSITEPVMQIDWEMMVFENLETHFRKLGATSDNIGDCAEKSISNHSRTAALWIGDLSAISFFVDLLEAHVKCRTPIWNFRKSEGNFKGDMSWWERVRTEGGYTAVDISTEIEDSIFDHNLILETDIYHAEEGYKKLFWKDGKPYFKRRADAGMVKAVAVHCFCMWRTKTSEIMAKAIAGYSD